ncbi:MAG: hypothetical protein IPM66_09985 [Acidobacteriota bacterium]|nr:MAG: hypothetical protein IPM66_09985 [Acidobacteriota bacterium]
MRRTHLIAGLIFFVIFLMTGIWLNQHTANLLEGHDRLRFSLRGNHVYILLSSLIHLSTGAYLRQADSGRLGALQFAGSILMLFSTTMVVIAFFFEPKESLDRPVTLVGVILALTGVAAHLYVGVRSGRPE